MRADIIAASMDADLISSGDAVFAPLPQLGLLDVSGEDARAFLHGQLSNDVESLRPGEVRRAGYCSPKGRLLASFLVIARPGGFLLQVSADIAAAIAKRLTMYVLRSKVKIADASATWLQFGVWGRDAAQKIAAAGFGTPAAPMSSTESPCGVLVTLGESRFLVLGAPQASDALAAGGFARVAPEWWTLSEVRAGVPLVTQPTQDQFVPQMANLELIGAIDFKKGCYPGQEVVARAQYRGQVKRRMYRGEIEAGGAAPAPGEDVYSGDPQPVGTIVNAAPRPGGGFEVLAVLQSSAVEQGETLHVGAPEGRAAQIAPLPYALPSSN